MFHFPSESLPLTEWVPVPRPLSREYPGEWRVRHVHMGLHSTSRSPCSSPVYPLFEPDVPTCVCLRTVVHVRPTSTAHPGAEGFPPVSLPILRRTFRRKGLGLGRQSRWTARGEVVQPRRSQYLKRYQK